MPITITRTRPDAPEAITLIDELEATLSPHYPDESRHGYSVDKLIQQGVIFFVAYADDNPAGCGGVQIYGDDYAEVKRMYVRPAYRGMGIAKRLLERLTDEARSHVVSLLRLETGIHQHAAIGLYESWGFERTGPFGDYTNDPVSVLMEKPL